MNEQLYYQKKIKEVCALISELERRNGFAISGSLRVSCDSSHPKYYRHITLPDNSCRYQYIAAKDISIAKQLAQQDYEKKLLKAAKQLLSHLKQKCRIINDHILQDIYSSLHESRKALVAPLVLNDEDYASKWQDRSYEPALLAYDAPRFTTVKGESVRSKSEKIIADVYYRLGIPYLYEYPLTLKDGNRNVTLRPDFTVLNKRTRQEYYHEHFGMIDDPEYANTMLKKMELYAANDISPGDALIITMESSKHAFNEAYFMMLVNRHFI